MRAPDVVGTRSARRYENVRDGVTGAVCEPPLLREAPWTAVAAATAFLPPPFAALPYEPKAVAAATAVQGGLRPQLDSLIRDDN
jgi:hypothetical protein